MSSTTPTRDTVLTVAIGRNDFATGEPLAPHSWHYFTRDVARLIEAHAYVVFQGHGDAVTSDGPEPFQEEDSFAVIAINPTDVPTLRRELAKRLAAYGQHSACFAIDGAHEPVFDTPTGDRPSAIVSFADATPSPAPYGAPSQGYAPSHNGRPSTTGEEV